MSVPKWIQYKEWSGIKVDGTALVPVPSSELHIDRAAYLATTLEAPYMGGVQSYDRCAMSGGPFHFTAVQPATMQQGSLFELLHYLEVASPCLELTQLWLAFKANNWYVARDGTLRDINSGNLVAGTAIRDTFTPTEGKVPKDGPQYAQAVKWASLFSALLSNPVTFKAQQDFAVKYLVNTQRSKEEAFYKPYDIVSLPAKALHPVMDLALCVYHAHSVNAPGPALKCLMETRALMTLKGDFGAQAIEGTSLIKRLGTYAYGRWQDNKAGDNRYDRTRLSAMRSKLWPQELFEPGDACVMPKDFL